MIHLWIKYVQKGKRGMTKEEIIDVIHKTMYQFFDVCGDNEEVPMTDKDELLLSVNKAICNNIKALEQPCEDAISRKKVLNTLFYNSDNNCEVVLNKELQDRIKSLPPVKPTQRWIPVKERLPEESLNSVIGWDAYRERCVFVQYIDGYFQITGRDESFNITAWMPLPEPYVPDTNDGKMEETLSYADQDTMQPAT